LEYQYGCGGWIRGRKGQLIADRTDKDQGQSAASVSFTLQEVESPLIKKAVRDEFEPHRARLNISK
jgi:hypothetical protein